MPSCKRTILLGVGGTLLAVIAARIVLAPRRAATGTLPIKALQRSEQAQIIEAMRPSKRERPVIAIAMFNEATEVSTSCPPTGTG